MTDGHHHSYVEILATVLLSLAAVATAWSGYQATRWNGEQAKAAGRTNAIRVEAARAQGLSESQTQVDVATFIQWVDAYALKRTELSDFYFKRFRKEFRPAVQAWLETRPLVNPDAPLTPFAMPQYKLAAAAEARRLDAAAEVSAADGAARHPAWVELRPRRRPLLGLALLRGPEPQAHRRAAPNDHARARLPRLSRHADLDRDVPGEHLGLSAGGL